MAEQVQRGKGTERAAETEVVEDAPPGDGKATAEAKAVAADIDSVLDEIDEVLETNAEEFVRSYVQKGGQ